MADENGADTVEDLPTSSGLVRVDIGGRTHIGKVRSNNEDNFHIIRFGRYLQTVASSLPDTQTLEEHDTIGYGYSVADSLRGNWHSPARAAAVIVFPHPGGPTKRSFRRGASPCDRRRSRCRCWWTISWICRWTRSGSTMSESLVFGYEAVTRPASSPDGRAIGTARAVPVEASCRRHSSIRARSSSARRRFPSFAVWAAIWSVIVRNCSSLFAEWLRISAFSCSAVATRPAYARTEIGPLSF
jgi:hypothetical protein